ncbi:galactose oxidase [Niabella ginsengisoli]|uniref:Galactose oxidase n=1 Tax=Niabella ginsengisoli TaxID=522298 RepID=A0ABS9SN75_9BACT|nr:galactose oxidase [Niabella ginsengisoli]MCH5599836.1 galactose oxidase [Niabella ginsengisoli]
MIFSSCKEDKKETVFEWSQLPQVPDKVGFAGCFAGVSGDHIIVAGGSQFPEGSRPWTGGVKQWNNKVLALKNVTEGWKEIGELPHQMGYGISLNWENGILLIGGADQHQHYRNVYFISYSNGKLSVDSMPDLPEPLANSCGAIIEGVVYVAGGLLSPTAKSTQKNFWSLDLNRPKAEQVWKVLPSWPGEGRMLSVAGVLNNEFYLLSGASVHVESGDTATSRSYLNDAFAYNPQTGWRKIKDLPHSVTAAPTPAYSDSKEHLLVFGGDDGSRADQNAVLKDQHPGFRTEIISYNSKKDKWDVVGNVLTDRHADADIRPDLSTWAPVTTPLVLWNNNIILPQGEARPGVRTNRVLVASPK